MPLSTSSHLREEHCSSHWCAEGEQIQSVSKFRHHAVLCNLREVKSSNDYFGYGGQVDVIGHCANSDNHLGEGEVGAAVFGEEILVNDCSLIITWTWCDMSHYSCRSQQTTQIPTNTIQPPRTYGHSYFTCRRQWREWPIKKRVDSHRKRWAPHPKCFWFWLVYVFNFISLFIIWNLAFVHLGEIGNGNFEGSNGSGKRHVGPVSNEFCCPISVILESDIPVAALEGGHTSMEPMSGNKALESTNWLKRKLAPYFVDICVRLWSLSSAIARERVRRNGRSRSDQRAWTSQ